MRDFGGQKQVGIPLRLMGIPEDGLWYQVELWDRARQNIERILARAADGAVAKRMFDTACQEYPGRYLTLSHGPQVVDQSE
jgi:hypothetical protein